MKKSLMDLNMYIDVAKNQQQQQKQNIKESCIFISGIQLDINDEAKDENEKILNVLKNIWEDKIIDEVKLDKIEKEFEDIK